MTKNKTAMNTVDTKKGYQMTVGRDVIRVISVFCGTRTASEVIYEAAVKKILFEKPAG